MEHNRKHKLLMIVALIMGIVSLSVGFAAFSTTLKISSSASVTPSSDLFSVKFSSRPDITSTDSIVPSDISGGVGSKHGVIDNSSNPTIKNLKATFSEPGQYLEYTFYVRNEGEYTAYLNSVNFLGEKTCTGEAGATDSLVQSACNSINFEITISDITYTETTLITAQPLESGKSKMLMLRIEYAPNGSYADGPFSITFPDIAFVYSTVDDPNMQPQKFVRVVSGDLSIPGSVVAIGNEEFYVLEQVGDDIKLLSKYNLNVGYSIAENGTKTEIVSPTGRQDVNAKGYNWDSEQEMLVYPFIGGTRFTLTNSRVDVGYDNSIVKVFVDNYVSYLKETGATITNSGILSVEEVEDLGCEYGDEGISCIGAPKWIYSTTYWTSTYDFSTFVYCVRTDGNVEPEMGHLEGDVGVRPVIYVPLSEF